VRRVLAPTPVSKQKEKDALVFITGWLLKYRCFDCEYVALVEMSCESITGIKRILNLGENAVRCPKCDKDAFRMVSANISRSKGVFGESDGTWKCPNHPDSYYPIPLARGFDIVSGKIEGIITEQYKEIARLGLPPKCPKCHTLLKYHRGNHYRGYGAF
jgi:ssDNA-binding Zn-finger/Zn-ribbon topoisomerase 1